MATTQQLTGMIGADYARVSAENDASPEQQQQHNAEAARDLGFNLAYRYREPTSVSASSYAKKKREEWEKLVAHLRTGEIEVLMVWAVSRGSREIHVWSELVHECKERGVLIYVTTHETAYDPRKRRDWKTLMDEGINAENTSREISENTLRGVKGSIAIGTPYGIIPYGYRREYVHLSNPEPGKVKRRTKPFPKQKIDPGYAPIVREIFTRIHKGNSLRSIRNDLNARHVPTPTDVDRMRKGEQPTGAKWQQEVIRRIALNPAYIAKRKYNGDTYKGDWEPIIDDATVFSEVGRRLCDPKRRTSRETRVKHLLSSYARCGKCGDVLHVVPAPRNGRQPYYLCRDRSCVSVTLANLDDYVTDVVVERLSRADVYEDLYKRKTDNAHVREAEREIAEQQTLLREWEAAAIAGKVRPDSWEHIQAGIAAKIDASQKRIDSVAVPDALRGLPRDNVRAWWNGLTVVRKRAVIKVLVTVTLNRATVPGRKTFDPDRVAITWKS